ncbi:MAG: CoA pyrophosphatase [bacterium]|nr:CoA pyrophosphatase [bacterium]
MSPVLLPALARALHDRSRVVLSPPGKTAAAVLVPLLRVEGTLHLLYTRRSTSLPTHQGQVAFPGGRRHLDDPDLATTALREAHEEIGLRPADVELLGALDDIETMGSRFVITPYVGIAPHPYAWQPSPHEVDTIFTVPLAALTAPDAEREETWDFEGQRVPIRSFPFEGQVIWGATHRITRNLLDVLETLP